MSFLSRAPSGKRDFAESRTDPTAASPRVMSVLWFIVADAWPMPSLFEWYWGGPALLQSGPSVAAMVSIEHVT